MMNNGLPGFVNQSEQHLLERIKKLEEDSHVPFDFTELFERIDRLERIASDLTYAVEKLS